MSTKVLGDAGEHYALSQFSFAGKYAAKMPDNWKAYDLAVETGEGLCRVSVKTRSESDSWEGNDWFIFDDRKVCDWLVFVFKPKSGAIRAWVIPFKLALRNANQPGAERRDAYNRYIRWKTLLDEPLSKYEDNWGMVYDEEDREERECVFECEGGAVYLEEREGAWVLTIDEGVAFYMLDEEDQRGIDPISRITFSSLSQCEHYLELRRWRRK